MISRLLASLRGPGSKAEGEVEPNPLAEYFFSNTGRLMVKWHHYFEIYHRHFARFRGRSPVVLEIGVFHGGSLEMWHHYFGPGTRIVGIDVIPECRKFENESTMILIGDQADRGFLAEVRSRVPRVDILIDDGGHRMEQQIVSFEELYPHVQPEGVYLCEDLHSSYMAEFGGGYRRAGTFIEYSKALVDRLNAWHSRDDSALAPDAFTHSTFALHYYDSVLVIEKRPMERPTDSRIGIPTLGI